MQMKEATIELHDPQMNKATKKEILLVSGILGIACLVFYYGGIYYGQYASAWATSGVVEYTYNVWCCIQMLYSVLVLCLPFLLAGLVVKKVQKREQLLPMTQPTDKFLVAFSIGLGFLALVAGNILTSWFTNGLGKFGVSIDNSEIPMPSTLSGYILIVLTAVIVPAFAEEIAFRGVVLHSLRRYGDAFAIGVSSLLFACMHGNMTQMPFAFLLGVVMGTMVVHTKSLWTSIFIHIVNNTYAVVLTLLGEMCPPETTFTALIFIDTFGVGLSLLAIYWFLKWYKGREDLHLFKPGGDDKKDQATFRRQAWFYCVASIPMLLTLYVFVVDLVKSIHTGG